MPEPLVLIVEDSPTQQRLLMDAFVRIGYTTRFDVQSDAAGAWAAVHAMTQGGEREAPAFAVIDIGLPGMSGINLVDRIRHEARLAQWPIAILTASSDPDDVAEAGLANATLYFRKPEAGSYERVVRAILDELGPAVGWDPKREAERKAASRARGTGTKRSVA